jgi:hypothetical protein
MNALVSCMDLIGDLPSLAVASTAAIVGLLMSFARDLEKASYRRYYEEKASPMVVKYDHIRRRSVMGVQAILWLVSGAILLSLLVALTFLRVNLIAAGAFGIGGLFLGQQFGAGIWKIGLSGMFPLQATFFDLFDDNRDRFDPSEKAF